MYVYPVFESNYPTNRQSDRHSTSTIRQVDKEGACRCKHYRYVTCIFLYFSIDICRDCVAVRLSSTHQRECLRILNLRTTLLWVMLCCMVLLQEKLFSVDNLLRGSVSVTLVPRLWLRYVSVRNRFMQIHGMGNATC